MWTDGQTADRQTDRQVEGDDDDDDDGETGNHFCQLL